MINTGKPSEKLFEERIASMGKNAVAFRLIDAAYVKALTGKAANVPAQPADYIVTIKGRTMYAEVKSTVDPTTFKLSILKPHQRGMALRITAAGGEHVVFVHSLAHDRWYAVPFKDVQTMRWEDMEKFTW